MGSNDRNAKKWSLLSSAAVACALLLATPALAHGGGGGVGGMSGMNGNAGGNSMGHMSTQGSANTNGPDSSDRDMGTDRASDRGDNASDTTSSSSSTTTTTSHKPHHTSASAALNSNGRFATTRTFGKNRAAARLALHQSRQ